MQDVVPPFSNHLDGIIWSDRLDARVGSDLLCDRFISETLPENFPSQMNLAEFLTFVIYSETAKVR